MASRHKTRARAARPGHRAAAHAETLAEALVPRAQRFNATVEPFEWRDPLDASPLARAPRIVRGYRRADPLRRIFPTVEPGAAGAGVPAAEANRERLRAADRLLRDRERGEAWRLSTLAGGGKVDCRRPPAPPPLDAARRYRLAIGYVGKRLAPVLRLAVFERAPLAAIAKRLHMGRDRARALLENGLDRLVAFYEGRGHRRGGR